MSDIEAFIEDIVRLNAELAELRAALAAETTARQEAERERDEQKRHISACETMIREHAEAASIFQPGGRFSGILMLGRSSVVEGIAWLVAEYDKHEAEVTALRAALARVTAGEPTDKQREAIDAWLDYGEQSLNWWGHKGYFSPGGWAYETLRLLATSRWQDRHAPPTPAEQWDTASRAKEAP